MPFLGYFLFVSFLSVLAFADGAASLVGKNSRTKNYTYSPSLKFQFVHDCSENANQEVCKCVLDKLQLRYSEEQYQDLDSDLRRGIDHPEFVKYISESSAECDASVKLTEAEFSDKGVPEQDSPVTAVGVSEAEATEFVNNFRKNFPKKDFVKECSKTTNDFLGKATLQKVCGCAYDRMLSDKPRFIDMVMRQGFPERNHSWGDEFKLDCVPEKFTPDIEKRMIDFLNERGLPLSAARCMVATLKKEYTLRSFLKAAVNSQEEEKQKGLVAILMMGALKCLEIK